MIDHEKLSTILLIISIVLAAVSWFVRLWVDRRADRRRNESTESAKESMHKMPGNQADTKRF